MIQSAHDRDRALVLESGLFDRDWYRQRHGDDSIDRYLAAPDLRGRDPGPRFSAGDYLSRYPDIAAHDMHPLVHYLRHGQAEGRTARSVDLVEAIAAITGSGHFDEDWYRARYPDVGGGAGEAALHYLRHGAIEHRDPSPQFSTARYLRHYADVRADGINPLLHYVLTGRFEERDSIPLTNTEREEIALIAAHRLFDENWYLASHPAAARCPLGPAGHYRIFGAADDPGPGFSAAWYRRHHADIRHADIPPFIHYIRHGEAERRKPKPDQPDRNACYRPSPRRLARRMLRGQTTSFAPASSPTAGPPILSGPMRAAFDILHDWTGADAARPALRAEGEAAPEWLLGRVRDLWFATSDRLRIRLEPGQPGAVRAWQRIDGELRECGIVVPYPDSPAFLDVALTCPFRPLLLTFAADGSAFALVPFPSLARGGVHHAEIAAICDHSGAIAAMRRHSWRLLRALSADAEWSLAALRIVAIGAPPTFAARMRVWLSDVAGVAIEGSVPPRAGRGHGTGLTISADTVPTLDLLAARRAVTTGPGHGAQSFLLTDPLTLMPIASVRLATGHPASVDWFPDDGGCFPLLRTGSGASRHVEDTPFAAIRFRREDASNIDLLFRRPLEAPIQFAATPPRISVVLDCDGSQDQIVNALVALADQDGVAIAGLVMPRAGDEVSLAATELLPEAICGVAPDAPFVLALDGPVILHDHRTLAELASLLMSPDVASATCLLLTMGKNGKLQPIEDIKAPHFLDALPVGVVPRPGGIPRLVLMRAADWPGGDTHSGIAAFDASRATALHLITTEVAAFMASAETVLSDPAGPARTATLTLNALAA